MYVVVRKKVCSKRTKSRFPSRPLRFESVRPQILLRHIDRFEIQRLIWSGLRQQSQGFIDYSFFDSECEQDSTCFFSGRIGLNRVGTRLRFGNADLNFAAVQGIHADVYKHRIILDGLAVFH
jgi:hypothetical protein